MAEILGDPVDLTEETTATFSFAANEAVAGFECWLDGIVTPCTSPVSYAGLGLGEHVFAVRAIDDTPSNPSEFEDHEWTIVASAPPQTVFSAELPLANTELTSASFSFEGTDVVTPAELLTFECSLDGAAFSPCTSPVELTDLPVGTHTFAVRAVDGSGTADPTPLSYEWTIVAPDTTAPETTINTRPAHDHDAHVGIFTFSADEFGAAFECALEDDQFGDCASPLVFSDLELGVPHPAGAGDRPCRQHRRLAGDVDMDGGRRHDGAGHRDHCRPVRAERVVERRVKFTGSDDTTLPEDLDFECSFDEAAFGPARRRKRSRTWT